MAGARPSGCHEHDAGIDPSDLELPLGYSSELGLERYAREYCAASGRSNLAVIYAIASVGVCIATQGGWVLRLPLKGGGYLDVPAIQFATAVAPSGWRKSTALDAARKALLHALSTGVRWRMDRTAVLRTSAEAAARDYRARRPRARTSTRNSSPRSTRRACAR